MAIVTMVLWVITAGAGISLLGAAGAARRRAEQAAGASDSTLQAAGAPDSTLQAAGAPGSTAQAAGVPARPGQATSLAARLAAPPRMADGKPPPVPRVTVATPAGEHPLLEFSHPMLAITGLACWFMFVLVHYRPMAWISFGILVATLALGLTWLGRSMQKARRRARAAASAPGDTPPGSHAALRFPPRLVAAHGLAAAVAITLTVLTAVMAGQR